ncbi:MAG: sarcosine oxidase subunit gamma family protein [Rhodospirillaceae bacterium]
MAETTPQSPTLSPLIDAMTAASTATVSLREAHDLGQINLRGDTGDPGFVAAVRYALGPNGAAAAFPPPATWAADCGLCRCLWLGPDEWLLVGPAAVMAALAAGLGRALRGHHTAVTDVGAARSALELSGPKARDVLEKGCALDLHPRTFGAGHCAGTMIAKTQVFLEQISDAPEYRIYVARSFARHFAAWLIDAMAEFSCDSQRPAWSTTD